jgi:two-component system, cell cycle response regulator DivK
MADVADTTASRRIKILLVEDSLPNRDMLTRRLQTHGFVVCSAEDGPSGVALSAAEMPDLILMDVALGAMDGWEATRRIKADARTANIPIIALTAHALATDRDKSIEVGCTDFDTKPVDLARLLGKIQAALLRSAAGLSASGKVAPMAVAVNG